MGEVPDQVCAVLRTAARESPRTSATACACTVTDCHRLLPARHGSQCLLACCGSLFHRWDGETPDPG